jgi:branched-chain amino acid aminotransferase
MLPLASLNGTVGAAAEARVPVTDEGLLRGDGVFEVLRVYGGRPFAWDEHVARLRASARNLRLEDAVDLERLLDEARALLDAHAGGLDCALRLVATRGGARIAVLEELKPRAPSIRLATVAYAPTRILDGVKSLSYAANMLATRLAQEAGADEALLCTPHGRVLEAPTSAFFYVLDGGLHTPPLEDHILDSITRRHVMAGTGAAERVTTRDDLARVEEAFLASTVREVQPVSAIDGRELPAAPRSAQQAGAALREVIGS